MEQTRIATLTREALEKYAKKSKKFDVDTLGGACAIASFALAELFNEYGYTSQPMLAKSKYCLHCFVETNGYYWDLTATQFKYKNKVLVTGDVINGIYDVEPADKDSIINDWPDFQAPTTKVVDLIKRYVKRRIKC